MEMERKNDETSCRRSLFNIPIPTLDMIISETLRSSSRSAAGILKDISRLQQNFDKDSSVLLFALSSNAPDLSQTVHQLGYLAAQSVGCLSAPEHPDVVSCSVALLDARNVTPFRSDIPGRALTQVGRWHSPTRMQEKATVSLDELMPLDVEVDWEQVWSKGLSTPPLPQELQKLQPVCPSKNCRQYTLTFLTQSEANSIVYFSDDAPEGFVNSLRRLRRSDKVCFPLTSVLIAYWESDGNDMLVHPIHNRTSIYYVLQRQSVFRGCSRGCNLRSATQFSRGLSRKSSTHYS